MIARDMHNFRYSSTIVFAIAIFCISSIALTEMIFRDRVLLCDRVFAERIAHALIRGLKATFATGDFPDKCLVVETIRRMPRADVVAIGSSRTMQIDSSMF